MKLTITEPTVQRTVDIEWISVDTPAGSFVFQPGHAPVIVSLTPESTVIIQEKEGERFEYMVKEGVLEVVRTGVHLICRGA